MTCPNNFNLLLVISSQIGFVICKVAWYPHLVSCPYRWTPAMVLRHLISKTSTFLYPPSSSSRSMAPYHMWLLTPRGALDFHLDGGGGCRWGSKTWPCHKPLGAQKIHPVPYAYPVLVRTDYSLFCCVSSYIHKNLLRPARTVAGARSRGSRACHNYCGPARTVVAGAEIAGLS